MTRSHTSSEAVTRPNPIVTAIVERAAAIAAGDHGAIERCTNTFAQLGCRYQQRHTGLLATELRSRSSEPLATRFQAAVVPS